MMAAEKRVYVLDTNVLMHDPTSLFRFEEHDVFIPMTVLEELDHAKKGSSEVSRNARQVSRFINELIEASGAQNIDKGLKLQQPSGLRVRGSAKIGRLLFQTRAQTTRKVAIDGGKPDNLILAAILELREHRPASKIVLVTKR